MNIHGSTACHCSNATSLHAALLTKGAARMVDVISSEAACASTSNPPLTGLRRVGHGNAALVISRYRLRSNAL